jgi:hypothetical protein
MLFLLLASIFDVNSSNINISGFLIIFLAIAIFCLCPPDNLVPSSPARVSYAKGNLIISSCIFTILQILIISISSTFGFP